MKTVKVDLSENLQSVEIHPFADWHIGDSSCNKELIKRQIEELAQKDNAYAILNSNRQAIHLRSFI